MHKAGSVRGVPLSCPDPKTIKAKAMIKAKHCDHKWVHLETAFDMDTHVYQNTYKRHDTFFCEKCLKQKTEHKEEDARSAPYWYCSKN